MCLAQGPQRSDAGEARTRGPSVSSQALYNWATALPSVWNHLSRLEANIPLFRGLDNKDKIQHNIVNIFLSIFLTFTLGAQKNRLTETVLRVHARFLSGSKRYIYFFENKSADICKDSDWVRAVTYLRIRHCSEVKNIEFDKKV